MKYILLSCLSYYSLLIGTAAAQEVNMPEFSQDAAVGRLVFEKNCAVCHGKNALGTQSGPPLLHPFYRPAHHDDAAFQRAIKNGAMAHHWSFGNMPSIPAVADRDIPRVIAFVRELQRANGIK